MDEPMEPAELVACYCFNKLCKISIFNKKYAVPVYVTEEAALVADIKCCECGGELSNWLELSVGIEVKELLRVA